MKHPERNHRPIATHIRGDDLVPLQKVLEHLFICNPAHLPVFAVRDSHVDSLGHFVPPFESGPPLPASRSMSLMTSSANETLMGVVKPVPVSVGGSGGGLPRPTPAPRTPAKRRRCHGA